VKLFHVAVAPLGGSFARLSATGAPAMPVMAQHTRFEVKTLTQIKLIF